MVLNPYSKKAIMVKLTGADSLTAAVWVQKSTRPIANIKGNCEPKSLIVVKPAAKFNNLLA